VSGTDDSVDIIESKVATGDDSHIYFLLQVNGANAIATVNTGAVALLDCPDPDSSDPDPDGDVIDPWDLWIIYVANGDGLFSPTSDGIYLAPGDQSGYGVHETSSPLGQAVGAYAEWSLPLSKLFNDGTEGWKYDCTNNVNIKFATYDLTNVLLGTSPVLLDETATLKGYNVPTTIGLQTLQASSGVLELNLAYAAIIVIFLGAAGFLLRRQLRKT